MVTGYTTQRRFKEPIEAEKKSLSICGNAPRVVIRGGLIINRNCRGRTGRTRQRYTRINGRPFKSFINAEEVKKNQLIMQNWKEKLLKNSIMENLKRMRK